MADLSWIPRESGDKNHYLWGEEHFGTEAPSVIYEKKPILDQEGKAVEGLYSAWIILNNPKQFNSYTTGMVKGVIAGFPMNNVRVIVYDGKEHPVDSKEVAFLASTSGCCASSAWGISS